MSHPGAGATVPDSPETARPHPLRVHLVRHGSSAWNEERRIQGQLDPPLSAAGAAQAERLGRRFGGRPLAGFYSSDLARARQTAEPIATAARQQFILEPGLREIGLGDWEGLTRDDIVARDSELWRRWTERPDWDIVPGGEGTAAFESRVGATYDRLVERHAEGDLVLVTHGGVIQVLLLRLFGRPSVGLFPFLISNASVTVLEEGRPGSTVVNRVNDTCHLS